MQGAEIVWMNIITEVHYNILIIKPITQQFAVTYKTHTNHKPGYLNTKCRDQTVPTWQPLVTNHSRPNWVPKNTQLNKWNELFFDQLVDVFAWQETNFFINWGIKSSIHHRRTESKICSVYFLFQSGLMQRSASLPFPVGKCRGRSKHWKQSHILATGPDHRHSSSHKNRGCRPYNGDSLWISNDSNHTVCSRFRYRTHFGQLKKPLNMLKNTDA